MTAFRKYTKYIKFFYFLKKQLTKDFDKGRNETRERLRDVLSYAENPLFWEHRQLLCYLKQFTSFLKRKTRKRKKN